MLKSLLSLSFALTLAACGGIVNFSPDGGEGGSGALGGGGVGPGPNTAISVTNAQSMDIASTGTFSTTCDFFCGQFAECFGAECFDICASIYSPGCEGEAEAYVQCLIDVDPPNCSFEEGLCPAQEAAYNQCLNGSSCFTEECSQGSDGSCDCFGQCFGTDVQQLCSLALTDGGASSVGATTTGGDPVPPQEELFCSCFFGGNYVGDCFSDSFSCNLEQGCCQQLVNGAN